MYTGQNLISDASLKLIEAYRNFTCLFRGRTGCISLCKHPEWKGGNVLDVLVGFHLILFTEVLDVLEYHVTSPMLFMAGEGH